MGNKDFKAYALIAVHAGRRAGLPLPTVAEASALDDLAMHALDRKIADSPAARKIRDELWAEFERRLREPQYTGDDVWEWFQKSYGPISRASIYRARADIRASDSRVAECRDQAEAYVAAAGDGGGEKVLQAAMDRAGQIFFQILMELDSSRAAGEPADWGQIGKLVDSLSNLRRSRAQADLMQLRVAEMNKAARAQVDLAAAKAGPKGLTRDDVYKILDDVMRGAA